MMMMMRHRSTLWFCSGILLLLCASAVDAKPMVLLLGDSMAVGQGVYPFLDMYPKDPIGYALRDGKILKDDINSCWRDSTYTAGARVAAVTNATTFVNLACAGASSIHVLEQWEYAKSRWGTLLDDAIVLVSIGANDALRLAGLQGGGTVNLGTIARCLPAIFPGIAVNTDELTDWDGLEERIDTVIQTIAAETTSTIRVVGYPLQFLPFLDFLCWSLAAPCARVYDALMARINTLMEKTVTETAAPHVEFVNVEDALTYGVCSVSNRHIRDVTLDFRKGGEMALSSSTFHPTAEAHAMIAERILESLAN